MLNQQTLEKLYALRLQGMAEAFRAQSEQTGITELSFEERFALLVDQQWTWRQNRALERRLAKAKLRHRASVEDIDFRSPRGLDRTLLARLARLDLLVVDDWAMAPLADAERRDFLEICEDRYQMRSMILTSQLPVAKWHEQIGDPTLADSILDRLVHNAHRIEMRGESMRKKRGGKEQ